MPCQSVEHFVPDEDSEEGTDYEEDAEGVQSEMEESRPIHLCGENNGDFHIFMPLNNSSQLTFVSHSGSFIAYDLMV